MGREVLADGDMVRVLPVNAGVVHIVLDKPARHNALDPTAIRRLHELWQELAFDRTVLAVVLRGEGRSFCSGLDITRIHPGFGWQAVAQADISVEERKRAAALEALPGEKRRLAYVPPPDFGKPVVCALQGRVSGAGLELALASDIRLASPDALLLLPEVTRGLAPSSGAMFWLPRIVGVGRALEMMYTGEPVDALRAEQYGLVNRVVSSEPLTDAAQALAARIAANAPLAVQATRDATLRLLGCGLSEALAVSENQMRFLRGTADYAEGFQAFAEKRPPLFSGR